MIILWQKKALLHKSFFSLKRGSVMALSHYNVLANLFRRMKNFPNTLVYAEVAKKNQVKVSFQTYV